MQFTNVASGASMKSSLKNRFLPTASGARLTARVLVTVVLAASVAAACGEGRGVTEPGLGPLASHAPPPNNFHPQVATITVTPNPATLAALSKGQFTAVGKDGLGNVIAIQPVWSVVKGGGTINATGLFTAGAAPGTFTNTVKATSGPISGTATVIVT